MKTLIGFEEIEDKIITLRGQKVLLDRDVATLYGVETKRVNEALRNNLDKFPKDYCFTLQVSDKQYLVENFDRLLFFRYLQRKHITIWEFVPIVFYCFINSFGFYAIKLSYIPVYQYFLTPQLNYKFFYLTFVNDFFIVFHPILFKNAESYTFNFILALSISFILHEKNSKNKSKRYNE